MSTTSSTLIFMTVCRRALKGYSSVIDVACVAQSLNHLHMEQQLPTLPEHSGFSEVRVARYLVFCVVFVHT